jgi:hypothetical protein
MTHDAWSPCCPAVLHPFFILPYDPPICRWGARSPNSTRVTEIPRARRTRTRTRTRTLRRSDAQSDDARIAPRFWKKSPT